MALEMRKLIEIEKKNKTKTKQHEWKEICMRGKKVEMKLKTQTKY